MTCVTGHKAYEFPIAPSNFADAKRERRQCGEGCSKKASSQTELLKEDIQWSGNLECQTTFDGLKQTMTKGPSLGVTDATKPFKVEVERFNCMLGEYLHHVVNGRQKNWVQLLNVAQFGHNAQTDSLARRNQFEIDGSRHYVLSLLGDDPYVRNNPQVHRFEEKWEHVVEIAQACLEKALRQMEKRIVKAISP
ncbi:reverse transcriptase [Cucumis melo var. makuwa]|uniref:Reverse transcriptase n=1 Tax=Cucumis melo var. makuwa TaxID=1194695 RepID=A0A5A7UGK9_CUCMM|nr:reverse transcriptase [Cucumis melo var. makuwa]TYJ97688.1 reverse transcriptase [Cucumis melo var. makuwa]